MSQSHEEKLDNYNGHNSEWEESLDANAHAMLTHSDTLMDTSEVNRRFLVTKDKTMMSMGATTKYLEVLYDGTVRIRDVKKSTYSDPIHQPWEIFKKDISSLTGNSKSSKKSSDKQDKLKIYMDGKSKKRYFKFSTSQEKKEFFKLIEDLRKKKNRSSQKKKYSTEPFIFAPYEVVGFFIRNAIVFRNGSTIKYRDKLIAITNYRIVVVDPELPNQHKHYRPNTTQQQTHTDNENDEQQQHQNDNDNNDAEYNINVDSPNTKYDDPLDQASSYKQNTLKRGDHIIPALTVPHHSVYDYDIDGDTIKLETKDYRTITIDLGQIENATLRTQSLFMMKRYLLPNDEKDIFAFAGYFSVTRTKTPSHSETDLNRLQGFPAITSVKVEINSSQSNGHKKYPQSYGGGTLSSKVSAEEKMSLYMQLKDSRYHISHTKDLIRKEYRRLGWKENDKNCPFRVTKLNENYELCETYPTLLLVPQNAKDNLIKRAATHRSRNRLPVITWSNSYNISLARSSQPQAGASHKRNEYDERLLLLLNEMNTYSETFVICDCRPRVNAIANQYMKGKGFESGDNYEKAHIIFFDIQNIHEMRKSVNALKKCCEDQFDSNWLKNLHETQWFQHITKIIQCSRRCANMIDKDRYSVLVHCSDGWDRTAQVCCLAQLLLDPYYRTFDGFLILVQKEWLWFGHKFADRNANYNGSGSHKNNDDDNHSKKKKNDSHSHNSRHNRRERSPIFLQFLDCCFQVMMQFPWAFDFTQDLLLEFSLHCNSGRFGDFFCNAMRERDEQELWLKTPSLFKYLSALWKLGRFRNPDYIPTKTVLRPRYAVRDMILWDEVYCRFTMHDKDRHSSSLFTHNINHSHSSTITNVNNNKHSTTSTVSDLINNSFTPRSHNQSVSVSHSHTHTQGKNRYHPRSPRISSHMFNKDGKSTTNNNHKVPSPGISPLQPIGGGNGSQYNSEYDDDTHEQKTPVSSMVKRGKPPPPPSRRNKGGSAQLPPSDTSTIDPTGDLDENKTNGPVPPITVDDDAMNGIGDSDSDSTSIPENVKNITMLQQKVSQLEAILKEYRNKENINGRRDSDEPYGVSVNVSTPSVSDYPLNTPNILAETPSTVNPHNNHHVDFKSEYKKASQQSKGNIV